MPADTKLIVNLTRGTALCRSEIADGLATRLRGLAARGPLPAGQGLLVRAAPSLHTAFMRRPIDALLLDDELKVLGIRREMRPWRLATTGRARAVLELSGGEAQRLGVRVGDQLSVHDGCPVAAVPAPEPQPAADDGAPIRLRPRRWAAGAPSHHHAYDSAPRPRESAASRGAVALAPAPAPDGPDEDAAPLSVLVISPDRRFRSVTTVLIAGRGCAVATTEHAGRLGELADRVGADVAVIDLDEGSPAGAGAVGAARALPHPIGIVLVDEDHAGAAVSGAPAPVHSKWGPFEVLFAAIETAGRDRSGRTYDATA